MEQSSRPCELEGYAAGFQHDGVVCMRNALEPEWIDRVEAGVERNLREPGPRAKRYGASGRFFEDNCQWRRIPEFRAFILESPAARLAGELLGATKINFFFDNVLVKEPGSDAPSPWHQDTVYWPIRGRDVVSFWLPLDPVSEANSIRLIRGSHAWGQEFMPRSWTNPEEVKFEADGLVPLPDINASPERFDIVHWDMSPGDCLAFQGHVVHSAPGNPTARNRRVLVTRWAGDDVVYDPKDGRGAPPFPDCGLEKGDSLDSDTFPVVWRRAP